MGLEVWMGLFKENLLKPTESGFSEWEVVMKGGVSRL
jgi:hypothetical protein